MKISLVAAFIFIVISGTIWNIAESSKRIKKQADLKESEFITCEAFGIDPDCTTEDGRPVPKFEFTAVPDTGCYWDNEGISVVYKGKNVLHITKDTIELIDKEKP
jgi:hypothetical protein